MKLGKSDYLVVIAILVTATAGTLTAAATSWAAPGDLDLSFKVDEPWTITTSITSQNDYANAVVLQPDGKLVVAGYVTSSEDFVLVRYNPNGSLDTTFNGTGKVTTALSAGLDHANALVLQPDGKLVVAGQASNGSNLDFALVRYNADGTLDTTFGGGTGKVLTPILTSNDVAYALVLQPNGKLVAAGSAFNGSNTDFALVRYNANGTLDTTFNGTGKVTTPIGSLSDDPRALLLQPDGKLVVAGSVQNTSTTSSFALVRYTATGTLDTTFNGTGKVTTMIGVAALAQALVAQPDGKLVAAGLASSNGIYIDLALARYNANGTLDTSFNGTGTVTTSAGSPINLQASSLVLQPDGKLVAAGTASNSNGSDFALERYNPDGTLDTSFNGSGTVTTTIGPTYNHATGLVLQPDGKLVAAGWYEVSAFGYRHFALARYNSDGSIDSRYPPGVVEADPGIFSDVAQQADGQLVAAGYANGSGGYADFVLARFQKDGTPDTTFGGAGTGTVTTPIGSTDDFANAVAIQADGRIIAAGVFDGGAATDYDFALLRYTSTGALDTTFGGTGKITTDFASKHDVINDVLLQPDGKIVAVGQALFGTVPKFAIARYNGSNGSLDISFSGGKVSTALGTFDAANVVAQQTDGKLVVAGWARVGGNDEFAVARYNPDGTLDTSFSSDGKVTFPLQSGGDDIYGIAIQPDGKIVVAGTSNAGFELDVALARLNPDGSLDSSFGSGGIVLGAACGGMIGTHVLQVQHDGKLLVTATYDETNTTGDYGYAVFRFNSDGSLDDAFGDSGETKVSILGDPAAALLQSDGRLVVAGNDENRGVLMRFLTSYCDPSAVDSGCRAAGKSGFLLKQGSDDSTDKLQFKWGKGPGATMSELADPTASSAYSLCVYDDNGLQLQATVPAGGTCNGKACWALKKSGYNYKDVFASSSGILKAQLKSGAAGKAKLQFNGRGAALPDLASPTLTGNVSVMVVNEDNGICFSDTYSGSEIVTNDSSSFKAKH